MKARVNPSQLPTHLVDLRAIDAIHNYVVYDYKSQWEALSAEQRKPFKHGYTMIRIAYLRIELFKTGDLSDKTQVEVAVQKAVNTHFPNAQINYKTITLSSFYNKIYAPLVSRKRLRNEE